jgi:hypothetical protein
MLYGELISQISQPWMMAVSIFDRKLHTSVHTLSQDIRILRMQNRSDCFGIGKFLSVLRAAHRRSFCALFCRFSFITDRSLHCDGFA